MDSRNPKFLVVDDNYASGLVISNYAHEYQELILNCLLELDLDFSISIFYEKQDTIKAIKDLSYQIGNVNSSIENNVIENDLAAFTVNDAKYIRKELQLNSQELYYLYIYILVKNKELEELELDIAKVEGILESKGFQVKKMNFRQLETYISTLPISDNQSVLKEVGRRNVLTNGLLSTYPFISSSIFDESRIFIGENVSDNSLIFIDRFDKKYKNANMIIFGTSGAGKSFFNKLMILRSYLNGIDQYIIDVENEYNVLADNLNGTVIKLGPKSKDYINIMEIREDSLEEGENGFLASKLLKLIGFFSLILDGITAEDKSIIETHLIEVYNNYGITFEDKSLYKNGKFVSKYPTLSDVYQNFEKSEDTKKYLIKLKPFVDGAYSFFNHETNVKLENKLIIANIYDLGDEALKYGMFIFIDLFWDRIKSNRNKKKIVYFDEIWRLIGVSSNKYVASFIFKIFKTIRKYGGSAVAITQDIYDIFSLENGAYGRSILNNSELKCFFSLEEENIKILSENVDLTQTEKVCIKSLNRSESLMFVGSNHLVTKIICSDFEHSTVE